MEWLKNNTVGACVCTCVALGWVGLGRVSRVGCARVCVRRCGCAVGVYVGVGGGVGVVDDFSLWLWGSDNEACTTRGESPASLVSFPAIFFGELIVAVAIAPNDF